MTGIQRAAARIGWYGLRDSLSRTWLGEVDGPTTFERGDIAQVAAQMAEVQLGWNAGRVHVEAYDGTGDRIRDELPLTIDAHTALALLEGGAPSAETRE